MIDVSGREIQGTYTEDIQIKALIQSTIIIVVILEILAQLEKVGMTMTDLDNILIDTILVVQDQLSYQGSMIEVQRRDQIENINTTERTEATKRILKTLIITGKNIPVVENILLTIEDNKNVEEVEMI